MAKKRSIVLSIAGAALSAVIAVPAFAAAPTYSGVATCISTVNGDVVDIDIFSGATKQEIAARRKFRTVESGFCENGSYDTSALTQDS